MNSHIKIAPIEEHEILYCSELGWYDIRIPIEVMVAVEGYYNKTFSLKPLYLVGTTQVDAYNELLKYAAGEYHTL
jgi:hypothetical protein